MEALKESHGVEVHWRSFELRPQGAPPISPEYRRTIEAARPRLEAIAREQYGLKLKPGPFGQNSRLALIGAKVAEARGRGDAYHEAVFRAYWQEGLAIAQREVLGDLAASGGLDRQTFLAALDDPAYDAAVAADVAQAVDYGLNSVPALVFAGQYLVTGAQPLAVLQRVTEQIAALDRTSGAG